MEKITLEDSCVKSSSQIAFLRTTERLVRTKGCMLVSDPTMLSIGDGLAKSGHVTVETLIDIGTIRARSYEITELGLKDLESDSYIGTRGLLAFSKDEVQS